MSSIRNISAFVTKFADRTNERKYEERAQAHQVALQDNENRIWQMRQDELFKIDQKKVATGEANKILAEGRALQAQKDISEKKLSDDRDANKKAIRAMMPDITDEDLEILSSMDWETVDKRLSAASPWEFTNGRWITPQNVKSNAARTEVLTYNSMGMSDEAFANTAGARDLHRHLVAGGEAQDFFEVGDLVPVQEAGVVTGTNYVVREVEPDDPTPLMQWEVEAIEDEFWDYQNPAYGIAELKLWFDNRLGTDVDMRGEYLASQQLIREAQVFYMNNRSMGGPAPVMSEFLRLYGGSIAASKIELMAKTNRVVDGDGEFTVDEKVLAIANLEARWTPGTADEMDKQIKIIKDGLTQAEIDELGRRQAVTQGQVSGAADPAADPAAELEMANAVDAETARRNRDAAVAPSGQDGIIVTSHPRISRNKPGKPTEYTLDQVGMDRMDKAFREFSNAPKRGLQNPAFSNFVKAEFGLSGFPDPMMVSQMIAFYEANKVQ